LRLTAAPNGRKRFMMANTVWVPHYMMVPMEARLADLMEAETAEAIDPICIALQ